MFPWHWLGFKGWGSQLQWQKRSSHCICSKYFEQGTKERRRDCKSSCKTAACSEGDDVCNDKEDSGNAKSQEAITGLVSKAIFQWHYVFAVDSVWFKDSEDFQDFLSICHNKCKLFAFVLETRCFSRGCQLWHIHLNIQAALTKLPEDVVYVEQSCNSPSGGI